MAGTAGEGIPLTNRGEVAFAVAIYGAWGFFEFEDGASRVLTGHA